MVHFFLKENAHVFLPKVVRLAKREEESNDCNWESTLIKHELSCIIKSPCPVLLYLVLFSFFNANDAQLREESGLGESIKYLTMGYFSLVFRCTEQQYD